MGGNSQPFLYDYDPVRYSTDDRLPPKLFDPKAITRASFDRPKPKPKPDGPLVSFNVHPDAFPPPVRTIQNFRPMGPRSKRWIILMRKVQLVFRLLQFLGAAGLLVIMIMLNNIKEVPSLVIRIALGIAVIHTSYGIYHLWRPAGGRAPTSSAAYHFGVIIVDIAACLVYAFGVYSIRKDGATWGTLLPDKSVLQYFLPAVQYGLIGVGGLHVFSIGISVFLAIQFWRISKMPPDMNPLEDTLISRAHKRNKSSVVSISTYADDDKRPGTVAGSHHDSSLYNADELVRPRAVPFMHIRQSSDLSERSYGKRESRVTVDLPERQYQISPGNSPRSSMPPRSSYHGYYSDQVPFANRGAANPRTSIASGRPSTSYNNGEHITASPTSMSPTKPQQPRGGKFQETWYATESLFNRTHERNRAMKEAQKKGGGASGGNKRGSRAYEAITDYYDTHDSDDDHHQQLSPARDNHKKGYRNSHDDGDIDLADLHPNPLRSNPSSPTLIIDSELEPERSVTPFSRLRESILRPLNLNPLNIKKVRQSQPQPQTNNHLKPDSQEPMRNRDSSIQPETFFVAGGGGAGKPYDDSSNNTILVAGHPANNRVVSSGYDHDFSYGGAGSAMMGGGGGGRQRHVSGKVAEEGMAGGFQDKKRLTVTNA
ncbi:hypothetical protein QBC32DRAFT_247452 [Pseudoneurospora amorphoporcata]|uniref:Uncharacterized protein n=1 Tax=Pseudoneurospora amorphoporcata TaxID=241081 RepID=A0AAN6NKM3_9PEZI|nr:hypothetical protein QBC32DRAFT_247452 [Pseudoneurospora amorphoporcata]